MFDGEVIIHFANGSRFKGMHKKGLRNGPAIEEDKDGKRFEGVYADGLRNGRFLEKDRNGIIVAQGKYEHGRRIVD